MAATLFYTTPLDVIDWLTSEGGPPVNWPTDATQQIDLVWQAEKDIDMLAVSMPIDHATGRRLTDNGSLNWLDAWRAQCIKDAVAAQVEYRLMMGPRFFRATQRESTGPDFSVKGKNNRVGPKAQREFARAGLALGTARSRA